MNTNKLNTIMRNMDMQVGYVRDLMELLEDCENRMMLDEVTMEDIEQLREHCSAITRAANTAKKLAEGLKPVYEEEDRKEAEKKKAVKAKKKAEKKEAPPADMNDDDDMSFLE